MENWISQIEGRQDTFLKKIFFFITKRSQSKVEIDPAMQRDAGYYECQAYNKHAVETKVRNYPLFITTTERTFNIFI